MTEPKKGSRWGLHGKTFWDWLELLIVPLVLALIGIVFTVQQDARQQQLEDQSAQNAALQTYLDQMNRLLLEKGLRDSAEGSEVRTLARAQTLTVLEALDPDRRSQVLRFLMEAELIQGTKEKAPVISLRQANLEGVEVPGANLSGADLHLANLSDATLWGADFTNAFLFSADLSGANLGSGAGGPESAATLRGANLSYADLSYANLTNAMGVTNKYLEREAGSLEGTIMPDGSRHP